MAEVKPIPDGYPRVTPYLIVEGGEAALEFYGRIFGARERMRMPAPEGKIGHAEIEIGDSVVMLADESPDMGALSPTTIGGSPVTLSIYVEDVDAVFEAALEAGATSVRPIENQFYGDRIGQFEDPFGHRWHVATPVEGGPPDEMGKRMGEAMGG